MNLQADRRQQHCVTLPSLPLPKSSAELLASRFIVPIRFSDSTHTFFTCLFSLPLRFSCWRAVSKCTISFIVNIALLLGSLFVLLIDCQHRLKFTKREREEYLKIIIIFGCFNICGRNVTFLRSGDNQQRIPETIPEWQKYSNFRVG